MHVRLGFLLGGFAIDFGFFILWFLYGVCKFFLKFFGVFMNVFLGFCEHVLTCL